MQLIKSVSIGHTNKWKIMWICLDTLFSPKSPTPETEREREIYLMNQNSRRRHSRHCINLYDQNLQKDEVDSVKLRSCLHESIMYFLGVAFVTHDYRKAVIFFVLFGKPNAHKAPGIQ
jgi:hypothetical protein